MQPIEEVLKSRPIKDPIQRVMLNIMYTGYWLQSRMNLALKPYGLTEPQFNVLRILKGQNGLSMNLYEIQERMVQRMSNVSRIIDKLLEKGWVVRKECKENRRRVDISITDTGLALLEELNPVLNRQFKELSTRLKKEEARQLSDWLETLRD